jgi:hypothetical protein
MLGSLCIYLFICHLFGDEARGIAGSNFPMGIVKNILYIVVIVTLVITYFFRKIMLSGNSGQSESNVDNLKLFESQAPFIPKYTTAIIVSLSLSESVGIYGLILFFLGDKYQTLYIFIGISALAMIYFRPKREDIEKMSLAMKSDETNQNTP